jgi:hypothetical protein
MGGIGLDMGLFRLHGNDEDLGRGAPPALTRVPNPSDGEPVDYFKARNEAESYEETEDPAHLGHAYSAVVSLGELNNERV